MQKDDNKNLKDFIDDVCDDSHLRVETDLGDGYFRLRASEAQRRQAKQDIRSCEDVVVEMLRNSRDAGAKNIFFATNTENNIRHILVIDDGQGIPLSHHKTIFEPYVTSKLDTMTKDMWGIHGRGMALYSILENSEEAKVIKSDQGLGASIYAKIDTNKVPQKRDQSSFPEFYINEDSELVIRGPKNIIRTACEFAVENRDYVNVFLGSPVEIAATLYNFSKRTNDVSNIFSDIDETTSLVDMLSFSTDVHDFKDYASRLGIYLSKRTARRIMDNDIKAQDNLLTKISEKGIQGKTKSIDVYDNKNTSDVFDIFDITKIHKSKSKNKSIKLDDVDKDLLRDIILSGFDKIADKYYLNKNIEPKVSVKNNKVSVTFDISEIE